MLLIVTSHILSKNHVGILHDLHDSIVLGNPKLWSELGM